MREIKFRGKCLRINDWVYGLLIIKRNEYYIGYISDISGIWSVIQVEPKTVGQYTGLKDKNGREIYEGDIVEQLSERTYESVKGTVKFIDGSYLIEFLSGENGVFLFDEVAYNEVLGNIYENPELLEESQNGTK